MINRAFAIASIVMGIVFMSTLSHAIELKSPSPRMTSPGVNKAKPMAVIIGCPSKLHNVNLSVNAQYSAPSGWIAKTTPTGYQAQTLTVNLHQVLSGKLNCSYGKSSLPGSYRFTTVSKTVPAGKNCTAISGYKFSCQ